MSLEVAWSVLKSQPAVSNLASVRGLA